MSVPESAKPVFPNYLQSPKYVSIFVWHILRGLSVVVLLALCLLFVLQPVLALGLFWGLLVPVLPILFFAVPGFWRNICPLAAINQVPRLLGFSFNLEISPDFRRYANIISMTLLFAIVPARMWLLNESGPATALMILIALALAFLGGVIFKGKSGWCGSICPLLPVQRAYGQTPLITVSNSHCQPCVGCTKNCYDFNPHVAYLADLYDADSQLGADRRLFIGAMPGFILAFFTLPGYPEYSIVGLYLWFLLYTFASAGSFFVVETYLKISPHKITALYTFVCLNLFYWFSTPVIFNTLRQLTNIKLPDLLVLVVQSIVLVATIIWLWLTYRKESLFVEQAFASLTTRVADDKVLARHRETRTRDCEVTLLPENKTLIVKPQSSLLDILELHRDISIEAGCRMGMCGADPITIVEGMDNITPPGDDEIVTLERLGAGSNTRLACCARVLGDVKLTLGLEKALMAAKVNTQFAVDISVKQVVIIGNGIAGITAADHIRRHHKGCEIHVVGRETHPLYNRMGISRLIYGRSAMQGLYLLPESWYQEHKIVPWLNTRAVAIDFDLRKVRLGTGEELLYDRLILAMGSRSRIPTGLQGFELDGAFALREADEAMQVRGYAQQYGCSRAVVAGGGILGLEAAYALHQLGIHVTILERSEYLMSRQLDKRSSEMLQVFIERMGIHVLHRVELAAIRGQEKVESVELKDGRTLDCSIVLLATGVQPNIELLEGSGLEVGRGAKVDQYMRTTRPEVFAAGDVAEPNNGMVYGLWPVAVEQGYIAGLNAIGARDDYSGRAPLISLKVLGIDLTSIGIIEGVGTDIIEIALEDESALRYRKLVIRGTYIIGAVLLGYPEYADFVKKAIHESWDLSEYVDNLRSGNWDVLNRSQEAA